MKTSISTVFGDFSIELISDACTRKSHLKEVRIRNNEAFVLYMCNRAFTDGIFGIEASLGVMLKQWKIICTFRPQTFELNSKCFELHLIYSDDDSSHRLIIDGVESDSNDLSNCLPALDKIIRTHIVNGIDTANMVEYVVSDKSSSSIRNQLAEHTYGINFSIFSINDNACCIAQHCALTLIRKIVNCQVELIKVYSVYTSQVTEEVYLKFNEKNGSLGLYFCKDRTNVTNMLGLT